MNLVNLLCFKRGGVKDLVEGTGLTGGFRGGVGQSIIDITYCNLCWPLDGGGGGLYSDATCDFAVAFGRSHAVGKCRSPRLLSCHVARARGLRRATVNTLNEGTS